MTLQQLDRQFLWHPFTQEQTADVPIGITKGQGAYLYAEDGTAFLDLISSWWVNLHGHGHPKIARAIYEQALALEHVIFAGFTHPPAVALCEKLSTMLAPRLKRFFFSDNGSTAVEIALKMAYQFWLNQGEQKRRFFLSFDGAYHGDTFGAMAVGKGSGFHDHFQKLCFEVKTLPYPATWMEDSEVEKKEQAALDALELYLKQHANETAAFITEPLLQGAGGMRFCRPTFLKQVFDLVKSHNILIIFDEVLTGFGRLGTNFAWQQIERTPDILCLSKGLSGGFLPLALTVVTTDIYNAFLGADFSKALAHGHSYTANPLGCAAALASLELLQETATQNKLQEIKEAHEQQINVLVQKNPHLVAPRVCGTVAAFNLKETKTTYEHSTAPMLKRRFLQEGLLIRPLGNVLYLLPPYCIDLGDLEKAYSKIGKILQETA